MTVNHRTRFVLPLNFISANSTLALGGVPAAEEGAQSVSINCQASCAAPIPLFPLRADVGNDIVNDVERRTQEARARKRLHEPQKLFSRQLNCRALCAHRETLLVHLDRENTSAPTALLTLNFTS